MPGRKVREVNDGGARRREAEPLHVESRIAEDARTALDDKALTSRLRGLLADLLQENERLSAELATARSRASQFEMLAAQDALLPVLNRRGFMRELERAISYVARHGTAAGLIFIDLDGFKGVNDRYGHPAGDAALRHIARILRDSTRASDTIGRLGGDEFAVILWNAEPASAAAKAGDLTALIRSRPVEHAGHVIMIGASAGATAIRGNDSPEAALDRADAAMYAGKRSASGLA